MSNDPLDAVFVTGKEAAELKRTDTAWKLTTYLERMPAEFRGLFAQEFQRISSAELVQLREKATEYDRIADLIDPHRAYCQSIHDQIVDLLHDDTSKEYPEIDALRARLEELESDHSLLTKRLEAVIFDRDDYALQLTQSKIGVVRANERSAEQARQLAAARNCITRRLRYHRNYPPVNSARWTDRENGLPGEDARDCDCDYCIEDRAWLAANPAPQEQQP